MAATLEEALAIAKPMIADYEKCRLKTYDDATGRTLHKGDVPLGICTIGYGHTRSKPEPGTQWTRAKAEAVFDVELEEFAMAVDEACTRPPTAHQWAAMTSLAYNIGIGGFRRSTALKAHNRGDHAAAARAFRLWNRSKGRELQGLNRRRAAEAALYMTQAEGEQEQPMPQQVDPESSLAKSPIAVSGGAIAATGATVAGAVTTAADTIGSVRTSLGDWLVPVLIFAAIIAVVLGCYIVLWRGRQRAEGWT